MMKKIIFSFLLLCSVNAFAQLPSYVPANGLIAWYPFTGNANDSSGNGNNGVVNGAILTTDRFGNPNSAYSFDGIDNYITCGNITAMNGQSQLSISAWFNATSNIHFSRAIGKEQYADNSQGFDLQLDAGNYLANNVRTSGSAAGIDSTGLIYGQWYHVVVVFDGTQIGNANRFKMYINGHRGSLTFINAIPSATSTNNYECWIGGEYGNATDAPWNGKLDDIGIWNRALTPCEVKQLYLAGSSGLTLSASDSTYCVSDAAGTLTGSPAGGTWNGSGVNGNTFSPGTAGAGTHFVTYTYTDSIGCTTIDSLQMTVSSCTGIAQNNFHNSFSIFPNPGTGNFVLSTNETNYSVRIFSSLGSLVFSSEKNSGNISLDLTGWAEGMYFVSITNESGVVSTKKIVVMK